MQLAYTDTMKDFAAIDFETANGKRTSVCSVGVVVVRGGEVVDTFYRLIRPRPNFYSHFMTAIHGLRYEDTADAPDFASVWREIEPRIEGLPLVAHYSLNIFSEIPFYRLSLYIRYLQMFSFGLNTHEISRF